jgi:hypothetical protein
MKTMSAFDTINNIARILDSIRTSPALFLQIPEGDAEDDLTVAREDAVRLVTIFSTPYHTGYDERLTRCVLARDFGGIYDNADQAAVLAEIEEAGGLAEQLRALAVSIDETMDTSERRVTRPGNPINVRLFRLRDTLNELASLVSAAPAQGAAKPTTATVA